MSQAPIYLNTAAFGLIDPEVKASADAFYAELAMQGSPMAEAWRMQSEPRIRETIAGLLGTGASNIAMLPNFSWGMNGIVQSLSGKERVLLYKGDFPSLLEPFRLNNFDIRWIDAADDFALPLETIERCIRRREVDVVALSHVQFNSGYKLPLTHIGALCREHGVLFIVDATQSLGAIRIDMGELEADVLIASNYKWMNAGFGTGIMYLRKEFLERYPPVVGGFNSYTMRDGNWTFERSARCYEPGHANMYGLTLLKAAIVNIQKSGVADIEAHNMRLTDLLLEGIRDCKLPVIGPLSVAHRSSIVLFRDEERLSDRLRAGGFVVTSRGGRVRISMHHYNSEGDVAALVSCLNETQA